MPKLTRRHFLQNAAIATAATHIPLQAQTSGTTSDWPENGTLIPDDGWHLWIDEHAPWQTDNLFLPEDITWIDFKGEAKLCGKGQPLPINPPTGGWSTLTPNTGKQVILPTTVEQHFWGKYGAGTNAKPRPYTPEEYRYAAPSLDFSSRPEAQRAAAERPAFPTSAPTQTLSSRPDPEQAKRVEVGVERPASPAPPPAPTPPADDNIPQNGAYFGVSWWHRPIDIPAKMQGKRIFLHIRGARLRAEVYLNQQLVGYSIMEELPFECDLTHAANPGQENHLAIRLTNPFGRFDWVDGSNAKWGHLSLYRSHGFAGLDRGITISAHDGVRIKDVWVLNQPIATKIQAHIEVECGYSDDVKRVFYQIIDPFTGQRVGISLNTIIDYNGEVLKPHAVPNFHGNVTLSFDNAALWDFESPRLYHLRVRVETIKGHTDTRTIPFGFRTFTPTGIGTDAMFRLNGRRIRIYSSISWGFWGLNGLFPVPELAEKEVTQAKALGLNCLNFHRNLAKEDVLRAHDRLGLLRYLEPGAGKLAIGKLPASIQTSAQVSGPDIVMAKPTTEAEKFAQRYMFVKCVEMVRAYRSHPSVIEYCLQNEIGADLSNPDTLAILKAMRDEDPSRCIVLNDGFVAAPRKAAQAWYEPWNDTLHRSDKEPWGDWWNQHQGAGDQWYDRFYKSPTDFTYQAPYKNVITEFGEMEGCARPDNHPLMVHQITQTYKRYGGTSYDLTDHEEIISGYERFIAKWGFRSVFPTAESLFLALGRTEYESWQNYLENARISDDLDFAVISGWESTAIENHSGIVDNLRNFKSDPTLISSSLLPIRPIAKQRALVIELGQPATFDLYLANDTGKPVTGELVFSVTTPKGTRTELFRCPAPAQTPDVFTYLLKEAFVTPPLTEEGLYRFEFSVSSMPSSTQMKELWVAKSSTVGKSKYVYPDKREPHTMYHILLDSKVKAAISGMTPALREQLKKLDVMSELAGINITDFTPGEHYDLIITSGLTTTATSTTQFAGETTGTEATPTTTKAPEIRGHIDPLILEAVRAGTPLLCIPQTDALSDGCARQLAASGAFTYNGAVGDFRAPWMGNWYFGRKHPLFEGLPTDAALGIFYQIPGRESNGLLVDRAPGGAPVEVITGYSRDHDRNVGAGTFTTHLGKGKLLYHRVPPMHPVLQQRFLANAIRWLTS
jgi:hypothetical protein